MPNVVCLVESCWVREWFHISLQPLAVQDIYWGAVQWKPVCAPPKSVLPGVQPCFHISDTAPEWSRTALSEHPVINGPLMTLIWRSLHEVEATGKLLLGLSLWHGHAHNITQRLETPTQIITCTNVSSHTRTDGHKPTHVHTLTYTHTNTHTHQSGATQSHLDWALQSISQSGLELWQAQGKTSYFDKLEPFSWDYISISCRYQCAIITQTQTI